MVITPTVVDGAFTVLDASLSPLIVLVGPFGEAKRQLVDALQRRGGALARGRITLVELADEEHLAALSKEVGRRAAVVVQLVHADGLANHLRLTHTLLQHRFRLVVVLGESSGLVNGQSVRTNALANALGIPVVEHHGDPSCAGRLFDAVERAIEDLREAPPTPWNPEELAKAVVVDVECERTATARLHALTDAVLQRPVAGTIVFFAMMLVLFAAVFGMTAPLSALIASALGRLGVVLSRWLGNRLLTSFVVDGVLGGTGTLLTYLPQIVILTTAVDLLKQSGVLARGVGLVDRTFQRLGLTGQSFLPLLMAHTCAVPAIAATRLISNWKERLTTVLVIPLMTCAGRIPVYALLISAFLGPYGAWVQALAFVVLYVVGLVAGLVMAVGFRRTITRGSVRAAMVSIPPMHFPPMRGILGNAWRVAMDFIRDVGTTILAASVVIWALLTVPIAPDAMPQAPAIHRSVAAGIGRALEPVTHPIGFDWRINVALIGSMGTRELMVSTVGIIFGIEDVNDASVPLAKRLRDAKQPSGARAYSLRTALSLFAFFVFACQCVGTLVTVRRELASWRWAGFLFAYSYGLAYLAALIVYQTSGLLGIQ